MTALWQCPSILLLRPAWLQDRSAQRLRSTRSLVRTRLNGASHSSPSLAVRSYLSICAVLVIGCSRQTASPLSSPSGAFIVSPEISGAEAGPTRRGCVLLQITDTKNKRTLRLQTGASDYQKWALAWSPTDTLVLYSSDIGTLAYDVQSGQILEREPSPAEKDFGREAYEKKYGKRPSG